jgi:uncharacterized protein (DUF305 family)
MVATGVLGLIAVAAIVWAIVAMSSNHQAGGMPSGSTMSQSHMGDEPGHNMDSDGTMTMDDQAFITMMVSHHEMAVDMAKVELARGKDPQTKALAARVIAAQSKEIAQMKAWYSAWYGTDVPGMPASGDMGMMGMHMDMDALRSTNEPDRMFLTMMLPHHASAVTMASTAMTASGHAELADLQKKIVAAQSAEMGQIQQMRERIAPPLG